MAKQSGGWKGQRGTRQERGYGAAWDRLRLVILRAEPLCRTCAKSGRATAAQEVDHIIPKELGGTDDLENLQPICKPCHAAKTTREGHGAKGHRERLTFDESGRPDWPDD